ncbi:MAG: HAMP domain-containing protein [Verrucomicrobia bacterium]|nr:HAMP domain-containing protein [Verrucomicrobiota bacterium]
MKVPQNDPSPVLPEYQPADGPRGHSIRDKLLLFTLALLSIAILGLSSAAFFLSSDALRRARLDGFRSLRESFSEVISRFFADHRRGIATQAESQTFRYAASELSAGYQELIDDLEDAGLPVDDALISSLRDQLRIAYEKYFASMSALDISKRALAQIADLSREGVIIQYVYVLGNSADFGAGDRNEPALENRSTDSLASKVRTAFSKTTYARAVERYQPSIEAVVGRNRYNDLLFIDNRGNVVYSFGKSWDLGTSVTSGWLSNTNLKKVFVGAWYGPPGSSTSADSDHVMVTDLEDYPARNNRPVMFLGCAISDRLGEQQGVLVHEIDSRQITSIITFDEHWTQVGLGRSGEAYIVGPDRRLRTESRFLQELPQEVTTPSYNENGSPGGRTSILAFPLHNQAVDGLFSEKAQKGVGEVTFVDERGRESLGVFGMLPLQDLDWGLVIRIDTDEAFKPAQDLARLVAIGGLVILVFAIGGIILFSHFLLGPIGQLVATAEKIGGGDLSARAPVMTSDEVGFLASRFNTMVDQVVAGTNQIRKILETVNEGLFLIGPDLMIQPGYSRATLEIFHREIVGLHFLDLLRPTGQTLEPVLSPATLEATTLYLELLQNPKIKDKLIAQTNPLLEVEFRQHDPKGGNRTRFLEFRFNRVLAAGKPAQIMVTALDVTTSVSLKRQIRESEARAQSQIEMLFGIMHVDPRTLQEFLTHTETQTDNMVKALEAGQFVSKTGETAEQRSDRYTRLLQTISRSLHLIKGNATVIHLSYFENLANQLEEEVVAIQQAGFISGEHFLPVTTGLGQMRDRINMTRELIDRLLEMQKVFSNKASTHNGEFDALAELAEEVARRSGKRVHVTFNVAAPIPAEPKSLPETVHTILTQLVRNAAAHGVELPFHRVNSGKHPVGDIHIFSCRPDPHWFEFGVRDDGRGLDFPALRRRAVEAGFADKAAIGQWREAELTDLLFKPGFTTLEQSTRDAGRGVGLDAVQDLAKRFGGEIKVSSKMGSFTEFRVRISMNETFDC